jgi:hypothetical protein
MSDYSPKREFEKLDGKRATLLNRCEQYAAWTIPSKFPSEFADDDEEMAIDFQSIGSMCVNNLLNKVMLALFAPSRPFFRPELKAEDKKKLAQEGLQGAALDATLTQVAKLGMKELEAMQVRSVLIETVAQLIITGNALLHYDDKDNTMMLFTLRDFVVKRTTRGKVYCIIIREQSSLGSMSEKVQALYKASKPNAKDDSNVSLYTQIELVGGVWKVSQSIEHTPVPMDTPVQYQDKDLPYRVLTWSLAPKRNYGTGMVEEAQGSFHALSTLSSAVVPGLVEMCRIIHLADPTGPTDATEFQNALSGDVLVGREGDIVTPDVGGKARDYATVQGAIERYENTLARMFLLAAGVVRQAERVTAEEIRLLANELETSLGGVYSRLSFDLQQWLAEIAIKKIQDKNINKLDVYVITGLDALSANGDLDNLRAMLADLTQTQNLPDEIKGTIIWDSFVQLLASLHNVDYYKFLKSQEELRQQQAEAEANAMAQQQELAATEGLKEVAVNELTKEETPV